MNMALFGNNRQAGRAFHINFGLVLCTAQHPIGRGADDRPQGKLFRGLYLIAGKPAQVLDNVAHPLGPLKRAFDQWQNILFNPVYLQFLTQNRQFISSSARVYRREIPGDLLAIGFQRMHVAENEADRIVQLMRYTGDKPTQCRHLFRADQMALSLFKVAQGLVQLAVGALQFAHRTADQNQSGGFALAVMADRAIER